jgi:diguanylate cyclase (GGDEF)-like protein
MSDPMSPLPRVLIVDDSQFHRELANDVLVDRARIETCIDAAEALAALEREEADLVFSDLTMPGASGLQLLEQIQRRWPNTDFILITANATVDSAIDALRKGATDYLQKPVRAGDLVLALERTLARKKLQSENERMRDELALYNSCRALATCLEPEDVYAVSLDLLVRGTGLQRGFGIYQRFAIPGSDGVHCRGFSEDEEDRLREAVSQAKRVDPTSFDTVERLDRGPFHELLRAAEIPVGCVISVPVVGDDGEAGALCVVCEEEALPPLALQRTELVAGQAAIALRNSERYRRARDRAFIDDTTDVYNARYLLEALDREIRRAERYGAELSILFLDLDRFKLVNDHHGHLVGSNVLRQISQLLMQCVRQVDTVARYGGDEFTVLLVDTGERVGRSIAERIRASIEENAFEAGPEGVLRITASLGIATYPAHGRTREAILDAADKAMYRSKSSGRNKVTSASEL